MTYTLCRTYVVTCISCMPWDAIASKNVDVTKKLELNPFIFDWEIMVWIWLGLSYHCYCFFQEIQIILSLNIIFRCDSISRNTLYTGYLLTHSLSHSQSWSYLLGQVSRPFRHSKDCKKGNVAILAIPAIMTIRVSMTIAAITAIKDIRAITASTGIRANCHQYPYYCQ